MGHGPGRPRRIGNRRPRRKAEPFETSDQIGAHRGLVAEQMGAAGHVEKDAVPALRRRPRRIASAPGHQPVEQRGVSGSISRHRIDPRAHRTRIGLRHPRRKTGDLGFA